MSTTPILTVSGHGACTGKLAGERPGRCMAFMQLELIKKCNKRLALAPICCLFCHAWLIADEVSAVKFGDAVCTVLDCENRSYGRGLIK